MHPIFRSFSANNVFLFSTFIAFASSSIAIPAHSSQYEGYSANVLNLALQGVRIKKLIDKMEKYKEAKNVDKLIECMLDIKDEAELSIGKKISIDSILDNMQSQLKQKGHKLSKDQLSAVKKMFKKKESKHNHKIQFMADCIEMGIIYDADLEQMAFEAKHKDDKPEIVLSLPMALGVTCCCVGAFLMFIPIPVSMAVGEAVCTFGASLVLEELVLNPAFEQDKNNRK
jgi:hypothetical protein